MIPYNKRFVNHAQILRKNMTPKEKHLWYDFLKRIPYNVRRQHNIENFIVDFYIATKKIVIELDGIQHGTPENIEKGFALAKKYIDESTDLRAPLIVVNSWNEWTEGTYLQPDDINGYGYLEAIKKIFIDQKGE